MIDHLVTKNPSIYYSRRNYIVCQLTCTELEEPYRPFLKKKKKNLPWLDNQICLLSDLLFPGCRRRERERERNRVPMKKLGETAEFTFQVAADEVGERRNGGQERNRNRASGTREVKERESRNETSSARRCGNPSQGAQK